MIVWTRIVLMMTGLLLATLLLLPFQLAFLALRHPWRRRLPCLWHRIACFALGLRVHVHGEPDHRRPLLLAVNHVSWMDMLVLGSVLPVTFIAKSDVKRWPVFGLLARLQETIFIKRDQKRTTGAQVNEIGQRLAAGEVVVLFPEGTTSDGNRLLEIKTSLFGAAASAVPLSPTGIVHVQPVAIAYTCIQGMPMGRYHRVIAGWPGDVPMGSHLMGILREGAIDVELHFGQQIAYASDSNRKLVSREIGARIRTLLIRGLRKR